MQLVAEEQNSAFLHHFSGLDCLQRCRRVSDEWWWEPLSKTQTITSSSNVSLVSALSNVFDLWIKTPPCPYLVCPEWTNPSSNITKVWRKLRFFSFFNSSASVFSRKHLAVANRRKFGATRSHEESILKNKVTEWETNSLWVQGSAEMIGLG